MDFTLTLFAGAMKFTYKIWVSTTYTSIGQLVWENFFGGIPFRWANKCLWDLGIDVFFVQLIISWSDRPGSTTPAWLTLSGEFVSIKSVRVAVWSVTLVGLVIIYSKECVKQNSKFDLVKWGISLLIMFCGFVSKHFFILRLQIYNDITMKISFLGFNDLSVAERAF